jgi:hypothetical protein
VLLALDLHKDFVDVEGITLASMLAFQSPCINGAELDTPKTDRFAADGDASFSEEIFNITVAQIKLIVEPDSMADDFWLEPVTFVCVHGPILSISGS